MIAPQLALALVASVSLLFSSKVLAERLKEQAFGQTQDINAMELLIRRYPLSGSTIPQALMKSIGHCKFTTTWKGNAGLVVLKGTSSNETTADAYDLKIGTSKENDTCLYFGNKLYN